MYALACDASTGKPYFALMRAYKAFYHLKYVFLSLFSCKMGVPGKTEGTIFSPIACEVILTGPERVGGRRELIINLTGWH